jgi:hypothetical protein
MQQLAALELFAMRLVHLRVQRIIILHSAAKESTATWQDLRTESTG